MRTSSLSFALTAISQYGSRSIVRMVDKNKNYDDNRRLFTHKMMEDKENYQENLALVSDHLQKLLRYADVFEKLQNWEDYLYEIASTYPEKKPEFIADIDHLVNRCVEKAILARRCERFKTKLTRQILQKHLTEKQIQMRSTENMLPLATTLLIVLNREKDTLLSKEDQELIQSVELQAAQFKKHTHIDLYDLISDRSFCKDIQLFNEADILLESLTTEEEKTTNLYATLEKNELLKQGIQAEAPQLIVSDEQVHRVISALYESKLELLKKTPPESHLHAVDHFILTLEKELNRHPLARRLTYESLYVKLELLKQQMTHVRAPSKLTAFFHGSNAINPVRVCISQLQENLLAYQSLAASIKETPKSITSTSSSNHSNFR